jgi:3-dehydroquinate synthase
MKQIKVNLGKRGYPILIGSGVLSQLKARLKRLRLGKVAVIVTNPTISKLYGPSIKRALQGSGAQVRLEEVPDSEESKSITECTNLITRFSDLDRGKGIFVVAFGGGVIGDLAGFAASVYRRGVPYIQVPTTLLAQVDSSIGGKVAVDLPCGKNLVGSFYQPQIVISDPRFLNSLGIKQVKQALAEIIKYAIIEGSLFSFLEKHLEKILKLQRPYIEYVIELCSKIKTGIVEEDEYDKKGKRAILNLGHTTGHALEAAAKYADDYSHGNAVALGIMVACRIAKELQMTTKGTIDKIEALLLKAGLPVKISGLALADIRAAQEHDKKFTDGKNRFILPVRIGKVKIKENVPGKIIEKAIKATMVSETCSVSDYE